jgi:hypothetical protein
MEHFDLDGTILTDWSLRVEAPNEYEALEEAERIISWIDMSPSVASTAQHRMSRFHLTDPEND